MKRVTNMTEGSPLKLILLFAIPLIFTNLGQQLYMIVDASIVGRGVGVKALAAVGIYRLELLADPLDDHGINTGIRRFCFPLFWGKGL